MKGYKTKMRGLFVTGTDTNVGKTVVSAALMIALRDREPVRYWKPIQTGIESDCDATTVRQLSKATPRQFCERGYRLEKPLSPHLSARLADTRIELGSMMQMTAYRKHDFYWIVEGAGGVLVPLNEKDTMLDLIKRLGLPVLVVARPTLGTINHTLLTLEALSNRYMNIAGVVLNGGENDENRKAIEHFSGVKVLGSIPNLLDPMPETLREWVAENRQIFGQL
jgi:dethiobiotin synthase